MIYRTEYKVPYVVQNELGPQVFMTEVEADSPKHAIELMSQRGLGEWFHYTTGYSESAMGLTKPLNLFNLAEAIHQATFVGFIGLRACVLTVDEVMGDWGLVHRIAHRLHLNGYAGSDADLLRMYDNQRRRIPGWPKFKKVH